MSTNWSAFARREWPHWGVIVAMLAASALAWNHVTPPIPVHWDLRGNVNGTAGRFEGLLFLPLITIGVYTLLLVVPRFDPGRANYASFAGPYAAIRGAITALMGATHGLLLATALGYDVNAGRWIPLLVGLMFIVLGNALGKVRPNYFVGIRTPWTLARARSWEKTHRAGGRLFVVEGFALVVAAMITQSWAFVATAVFGGGALVWLIVYSYLEWRADPDRVPVTGTRPAEDR